jgi:hypothetical protein
VPAEFPYHTETTGILSASLQEAFTHLDDHNRLSAHMSRRTWRTGWGKMQIDLDDHGGRAIGSHIRLSGRVFGVWLEVDEVVIEYDRPVRKVWQTVGTPRLLVIGPYRMGFSLVPVDGSAPNSDGHLQLTVFIDYRLPLEGLPRILGRAFGHWYARWCTARMVADVLAVFGPEVPRAVTAGSTRPREL